MAVGDFPVPALPSSAQPGLPGILGQLQSYGVNIPGFEMYSPEYLAAARQAGLQYPLPQGAGGSMAWAPDTGRVPNWLMRDVNPMNPVRTPSNPRMALEPIYPARQVASTPQGALGAGEQMLALPPGQQAIPMGPAGNGQSSAGAGAVSSNASKGVNVTKAPFERTLYGDTPVNPGQSLRGTGQYRAADFNFQPPGAEPLFENPPFDPHMRTTLNQPASQIINQADITNAAKAASAADEYATAPGRVTSVMDDYTTAPGRVLANEAPEAIAAAEGAGAAGLGGKFAGLFSKGGPIRNAGWGLAGGIGVGMGLNTLGDLVAPRYQQAGDVLHAGGRGALYGGGIVAPTAAALFPSSTGVGAGVLGGTGAASLAGAGAAAAGVGAAQGFSASGFGNDVINNMRGQYEGSWTSPYDYAVSAASGTMGLLDPLARLFGPDEKTNDTVLDVMGNVSGGGEQEAPTPQNMMDRVFDTAQTDPTTRSQLQKLYDLKVAGGDTPEKAAKFIISATQQDFSQKQQQQQALGQLEAQRAQAIKYMQPYTDAIRRQGEAKQQLLQQLIPTLPAAYQGYGNYLAGNAIPEAEHLANSYLAQVSMAPSQIQQQQQYQAQQAYQQQIMQQLQAAQIQADVQNIQAQGGVAATPAQGL